MDFQVFPRRFAKTELYGYSVMDAGVGMFVAINALVAPEVQNTFRPLRKFTQLKKAVIPFSRYFSFFFFLGKILERAAYHVGVLISLGFLRLLSVKLSGYHEHITEYGVHWNFFFTLAAIKVRVLSDRVQAQMLVMFLFLIDYQLSICGATKNQAI